MGIGAAALFAACGDDDDVECGAGTEEIDGECVPAGPDGGVGDGCGAGTRPDGDGGCIASMLPSDLRSCIGRFGPIGVDAADTLYVDGSYTGGGSDGSTTAPYTTIQAAVDDAGARFVVAVASGTYDEDVDIDAPLALEGRCAREVTIDGTVTVTSGGTVIRGVTVTNGSPGILLRGSLPAGADPFGTVIGTSVIEMNGRAGIHVEASSLDLDFSEVRLTLAMSGSDDIAEQGSGLYVFDGSFVHVGNSVIEMNGGHGLDFADATGPLGTVADSGDQFLVGSIRSSGVIEMNVIEMNGQSGVRISAFKLGALPDPGSQRVSVLSNMINNNGEHGIAAVETIVDISGNDLDGNGGSIADSYAVAVEYCRAGVTGNMLSGSDGGGVHVINSQAAVAGNTISGFPNTGIVLTDATEGGTIANNLVTGVGNVGIIVFFGTDVVIDGNEVTDTKLFDGSDRVGSGHGIFVRGSGDTTPGFFDLRNNHVHDNAGSGVTLDELTPLDETEPLYFVAYNTVERNGNIGINIQSSGDGDVWFNDVIDNERFGIRGVSSAVGSARIRAFVNNVSGTTISALGEDGDGIAMIDSHVGIGNFTLGNNVQNSERAGIMFTGASSGFCNENQIGDIDSNGQFDAVYQLGASTGMSESGNSYGIWGATFDGSEQAPVDATPTGHGSVPKPLQ